jgi:hypothetical protein
MAETAVGSSGVKDIEYFRMGKLVVSKLRLGKFMFYVTCACGVWFFYWFNVIQCPC